MGKTRDLANLVDYISVDGSGNVSIPTLVGGGGGVTTVTAISATPNANGATISGSNLTLTAADATNGGVMTASTQSFGGLKTFTGTTASDASTLSAELLTTGTGTGWTGTSFATGYTHTTGAATYLDTGVSGNTSKVYKWVITISGLTAGNIYGDYAGLIWFMSSNGTYTFYSKPSSVTTFKIYGSSTFNGTVVFSLKEVVASVAITSITNNAGTQKIDFRTDTNTGNIYIGSNSGVRNVTGTSNVSLGTNALQYAATSNNNTAIGWNAMSNSVVNSNNTAVGANAMASYNYQPSTSAYDSQNTAIGANAMLNNAGVWHTAIGYNAMQGGSGVASVAVGIQSLGAGAFYSTAIGYNALISTTGDNNTALGYRAGSYFNGSTSNINSTGTNSIFIGFGSGPLANAQANQIVIGYNAIGNGANTTVIGNSSTTATRLYGNLLLGTNTDNGQRLQVNGNSYLGTGITTSNTLNATAGQYANAVSSEYGSASWAIDLATLFPNYTFTSRGLSVILQIVGLSDNSNGASLLVNAYKSIGGTWVINTVNTAQNGTTFVNSITGSTNTITINWNTTAFGCANVQIINRG